MRLFGRFKKDKQKKCYCDGCCDKKTAKEVKVENTQTDNFPRNRTIKVFGSGCTKCKTLKENVMQALSDTSIQVDFEYVTDMGRIAEAGIMVTPALEVDGKIVSSGKVIKSEEILRLL